MRVYFKDLKINKKVENKEELKAKEAEALHDDKKTGGQQLAEETTKKKKKKNKKKKKADQEEAKNWFSN